MPELTKPPFSMVGIDHVVFLVDDLARATRWYAEILGCQPGYSYPKLGMEQVWCGAALIVLWDITHPGAASGMGNSFYVLDPWGNKLELKGPAVYPDGRSP